MSVPLGGVSAPLNIRGEGTRNTLAVQDVHARDRLVYRGSHLDLVRESELGWALVWEPSTVQAKGRVSALPLLAFHVVSCRFYVQQTGPRE